VELYHPDAVCGKCPSKEELPNSRDPENLEFRFFDILMTKCFATMELYALLKTKYFLKPCKARL
jgi:hypothetical protein